MNLDAEMRDRRTRIEREVKGCFVGCLSVALGSLIVIVWMLWRIT